MKNLKFSMLLILIIGVSCKNQPINNERLKTSDFSLQNDYSEFQELMSDADTILVWMNHSLCTYEGMEKFHISKKNDSLTIVLFFKVSAFSDKEYVKQKTINISVNDTSWGFGKFLEENKFRIKPNENNVPTFRIYCNTQKISYYTYDLADKTRFIIDYCIAMKRLNPESPYYDIADIEDMELEIEIDDK